MKKALVLGAGGFIGHHLVRYLKNLGFWVRGVDLKYPEYSPKDEADDFIIADLRDQSVWDKIYYPDWIYGKVNFYNTKGEDLKIIKPNKLLRFKKPNYFAKYLLKLIQYVPHQAVFIKKEIFEKYGLFDEELCPILPDLEFFKRIRNDTRWLFFDRIIANFVLKAHSERSLKELNLMREVKIKIYKKYFTFYDYIFFNLLNLIFKIKNLL